MKKIDIREIDGFRLGTAENKEAGTGVTVILCENGATAGVDVRGGGPATRETDLLKPENMIQQIHGVVISGGSAYGLEAASGVMNFLEEKGIGFDVGVGVVPIVCGASLFDLAVGNGKIRPDREMGYEAANLAWAGIFKTGNHGAGTGATVGKYRGIHRCMKGGQGTAAVQIGELQVGAVTAVNALGDIFDEAGVQIAGLLSEDGTSLSSTSEEMQRDIDRRYNVFRGNTTISCILTNGKLTKAECTKLAAIAQDAYARRIRPVHTTADGDTIFVLSTNQVEVNFDALAVIATEQVEKAILDGVRSAEDAYGLKASKAFGFI